MEQSFDLIVTAAGSSHRFNSLSKKNEKKECILIDGKSVLYRAISPFLDIKGLKTVIVTYPKDRENDIKNAIKDLVLPEGVSLYFVEGGNTRTHSIKNGFSFLSGLASDASLVAIHDGARPFIRREIILETLEKASIYGSSAPGLKISDAVKRIDNNLVIKNEDRTNLIRIQTPQIFDKEIMSKLYLALDENEAFQDDVELYTEHGGKCYITEGSEENKKITYRKDIERKEMRVGFGNDIHRLSENRKLYIGGVLLPHSKGEAAHSDGDVLLHALIDALLGAKALGDIGHFFPPEDNKWKDSDSKDLLRTILKITNVEIINVDAVITLEGFKLSPYIDTIRESLSTLLSLDISKISVKAKTNEGLDSLGKGDAIKAEVVVLING